MSATAHPLEVEVASLHRLLDLSAELTTSANLDDVLRHILDGAIALHKADFGSVRLYNAANGKLEIVAQHGFEDNVLRAFALVSMEEASICSRALREKRPITVVDVKTDPGYEQLRALAARAGYRSVQSTPLIARSEGIIGMLSTHFRAPRELTPLELQLTELYAGQAAEMIVRCSRERDLSQREQRQRLLLEELSHRTRNMFAIIQAAGRRIGEDQVNPQAIAERLIALGRAQMLLAQSNGETSLEDLCREQLDSAAGRNVACVGPPVRLGVKDSFNLGLILHELLTNARKYGALSSDSGAVSVAWSVRTRGAEADLQLCWRETNGPPVTPPTRAGFGSTLLENLFIDEPRAQVALRFEPAGVICEMTLPLEAVQPRATA